MGDGAPPEPPTSHAETPNRDRRHRRRSRSIDQRTRHPQPPLPKMRHKRNPKTLPSSSIPLAPQLLRRLHRERIPRAQGHDADGQRLGDAEGPEAVGAGGRVPAGEI
ncbi:unnamed protein product [Linum tenue]|uniref:Uncharacterized protein n=1 Tax=Linum tenue TaxID=586396 RepID=A0AAV0IFV0_9ROSI|nr:unnamed protein product [Linum tenue]